VRAGQDFHFGFADSLLAEVGNVEQKRLHFEPEAILQAYENVKPVARRLGVLAPGPRLAGLCYTHVAALGAEIVFPRDGEPKPLPILRSSEEIPRLAEPRDYLSAPLIQARLQVWRRLKERCPDAVDSIGHQLEGPATTAVLIMGSDFLRLPYDQPGFAHRLLDFSTRSALNYARAISEFLGAPIRPGPKGMPDDFAGIFAPGKFEEFVVPYWERVFEGLEATERHLHSELLRVEHLRFLKQLRIDSFDPSADQYLTPELLRRYCPCPFECRIQSWEIHNLSAAELEKMYRRISSFRPHSISFYMQRLEDEPKIRHLLAVARELQEEAS